MNNKGVYLAGPATASVVERLQYLFPGKDIHLLSKVDESTDTHKTGMMVVVALDDYVGVGKELLLLRCLLFKPDVIAGLNKDGDLVVISNAHIIDLLLKWVTRWIMLPFRFLYVGAALVWSPILRLYRQLDPIVRLK